jgi:CheY-like chemotaxis protein
MLRIVHLEDEKTLRDIMKIAITATIPGVNVTQFVNSDDMVGALEQHLDAELFILDIRVPGDMDGLGVARALREKGSESQIIVTSAYRKPEQTVMAELKLEWMPKPWHITQMTDKLISLNKNGLKLPKMPAAPQASVSQTSFAQPGVAITPSSVNRSSTPAAAPAVSPNTAVTPSASPNVTVTTASAATVSTVPAAPPPASPPATTSTTAPIKPETPVAPEKPLPLKD